MQCRTLGKSGIQVSEVSFGAGPVSGLMVGDDHSRQLKTVEKALQAGVNWLDTAATYGDGRSEESLGNALASVEESQRFQIATKVRLTPEDLDDIPAAVDRSIKASLSRLRVERVTLLQLHNSVTCTRGELPTSLAVDDVLGAGGVVSAFRRLKDSGKVEDFGFTGLGDRQSLDRMIKSGEFTSVQVPFNLLTPFAGNDRSAASTDVDYQRLIADCRQNNVGVIAIRVFAGGAIVEQPPSPHTYKTTFFPLDLFVRDQHRAAVLQRSLPAGLTLAEASIRFVLSTPGVTTALLGFAQPEQITQAVSFASQGPLDVDVWERLCDAGATLC